MRECGILRAWDHERLANVTRAWCRFDGRHCSEQLSLNVSQRWSNGLSLVSLCTLLLYRSPVHNSFLCLPDNILCAMMHKECS